MGPLNSPGGGKLRKTEQNDQPVRGLICSPRRSIRARQYPFNSQHGKRLRSGNDIPRLPPVDERRHERRGFAPNRAARAPRRAEHRPRHQHVEAAGILPPHRRRRNRAPLCVSGNWEHSDIRAGFGRRWSCPSWAQERTFLVGGPVKTALNSIWCQSLRLLPSTPWRSRNCGQA